MTRGQTQNKVSDYGKDVPTLEVYILCSIYCSLLYTLFITLINIILIQQIEANFGKLDMKTSQAKLSK